MNFGLFGLDFLFWTFWGNTAQTDRHTGILRDKKIERKKEKQTDRQMDKTDRQTVKQTDRQTARQTDMWTYKQAGTQVQRP